MRVHGLETGGELRVKGWNEGKSFLEKDEVKAWLNREVEGESEVDEGEMMQDFR